MAYFVSLKSGATEIIVNMENVAYILGAGERCGIHFIGDKSVSADVSAHAVIGMAQNGAHIPPK